MSVYERDVSGLTAETIRASLLCYFFGSGFSVPLNYRRGLACSVALSFFL